MKKIYLLSAVAALGLASCNDYDDQFNLGNQVTDIKNGTRIVLTNADYKTIAGLEANKAIAAQLDAESNSTAYTEALEELGNKKYFGNLITPERFLPAFIRTKYKEADAGSKFKVSYNMYIGKSEYLASFDNLKGEYTLTSDDYSDAWEGASSAKYLTPKTVAKLPEIIKDSHDDAEVGDIYVVNYAYSDFEPAGGGETPGEKYDKISDVIANTDGGQYSVKGIVCATYKTGFLLKDNTGYILVYKASEVSVGDEVAVSGTTTLYGGLMQFPAKNTELEVKVVTPGKEPNFKNPTAKNLVAADFEAYSTNPYVAYVTYKGNLSITTNSKGYKYYNVTIDGTEKQGSLANVPDGLVDEGLNGKDIVVYGYSIGATGTEGKYLNTMVTSVAEASAAAKAKVVARAANGGANKSVVYRYDGKAWKVFTNNDAVIVAAQPAWYDLIGSTTVAKPDNYFPTLLQNEYPFAVNGKKVAVVYRNASSAMAVVEYAKTATGWVASKEYKQKTTPFLQTESGFEVLPSTYLEESLLGDKGGFEAYDVKRDQSLTYVWQNTAQYGWKASAFTSGSCKESESWLVSPTIDLTESDSPQLVFDEAMNKLGAYEVSDYLSVAVSDDFSGDVNSATWEMLEVKHVTDGNSWNFFTVDPISLANYVGKNVHIAFIYKSNSDVAPTYELKNFVVSEAE